MRYVLLTLVVGIAVSGCNYRREKVGRSQNQVSEGAFARIKKSILEPKCVDCHAGKTAKKSVDLSSYEAILRTGSVVPGNPKASPLLQQLEQGLMPPEGKLSNEDIRLVEGWIQSGAPQGAPEQRPTATPPAPPKPPPVVANEPDTEKTYRALYENILRAKCGRCHGLEAKIRGGVDLTSLEKLRNSDGETMKPLVPGDPAKSGIYDQVVGDQPMPPGQNKLSAQEAREVFEWIQEGAKP